MIIHLFHTEGALFVFCVLSANDRKRSIIALTFCGLFLPFTASKLCLWMHFPEHMHAVSLVFHYSAFPSSQIPHKTLCSLSNSCFSCPFFSSQSSPLNDLNVLGIFSHYFFNNVSVAKGLKTCTILDRGYFHSFCGLALNVL